MTKDQQKPGGGAALKQAIHVARARADITSDSRLAIEAGVSYDTLMNWFGDRTTPRPAELKKVADTLGVRLVDLMDAWEGRDPQTPGLEEAIRELIDELRLDRIAREESTAAMLRAFGALALSGPSPRATPGETGPGAPGDIDGRSA